MSLIGGKENKAMAQQLEEMAKKWTAPTVMQQRGYQRTEVQGFVAYTKR